VLSIHVKNRVYLSHDMQVICVAWRAVMRIVAGEGDLVQRTGGGQASTDRILGGRMIESSGDAVCCLHRAQGDKEHEFLG
jgi:hypothetical protein